MPKTKRTSESATAYRSGFEKQVHVDLLSRGVEPAYEAEYVEYQQPASTHRYTPDFKLPNGIYIETKGRFLDSDRMKHLHVKASRPDLDIRFVFMRSSTPIRKGSPTTYAMWCKRHGFKYADKRVPQEWIDE